MGQKDDPGFTSPMGKKELDRQTKEECLLEPLRRLEQKNEKLKKTITILEYFFTKVIPKASSRDAIESSLAQDMQIKINHLHKQLKHLELIGLNNSKELQSPTEALGAGSSQEKEVSPTQKTAMVKQKEINKNSTGFIDSLAMDQSPGASSGSNLSLFQDDTEVKCPGAAHLHPWTKFEPKVQAA
ncbi:hypothetical protein DUI87_18559 [Hirundo rustica rustica]|uniref:Uncharacterized protein n=1 Tax=Hirundo rustica rustica TaxID=333673 RepID=A0A3M0K288_HIRRU|nr:hypothetical protein DUI87_18559 [Hirundo rustica rustica]